MVKKQTPQDPLPDNEADKVPLKKRWSRIKLNRRNIDRRQRAALRHARKFLVQRWDNLRTSRREVISWLFLAVVLIVIGCLQTIVYTRGQETIAAADGGTYAEGVVDKIATISPLYVVTDAEQTASGLVYASLFRLDEAGYLRPDLATSYSVSKDGETYSVQLRDNVRWSDGQTFSADDVVLTIELIKNPTIDSPLFERWKNIEVKKTDKFEVTFKRKNALASFPFMLDFGVLPAHILKDIKPADIKSTFSNNPAKVVGTGAFVYHNKEVLSNGQTILKFAANEHYFRGTPRVKVLTIQTYATSDDLFKGFKADEVNVAAGLGMHEAAESLDLSNANLVEVPLGDGVFALFNNSGKITGNRAVREALRLGADRSVVRAAVTVKSNKGAKLKTVTALETPLASGLITSVDELSQPDYDIEAAGKKLDTAGWKLNADGKRAKDDKLLTLSVVTVQGAGYELAAQNLAEQWRDLGIEVEVTVADPSNVQQNFLIPRAYDVLVYQFHLGADPDVSAYWTSSQATAHGSNFANYRSKLADVVLSNACTRLDSDKRAVNYTYFVKNYWLSDVPAIALYQPNYYYLAAKDINGLDNTAPLFHKSMRLAGVHDFTVNVGKVKTTP
ncbi:MAG: peptide ABC transporter substrate-binding protein [Candidatus Nomurabacteria bacterium]|jgi:peptide/nickel transport system substrate-binding protein|nr:peptide ABC transporter substrate-binding protein [Candidatus Nomurabacteria bacterium]